MEKGEIMIQVRAGDTENNNGIDNCEKNNGHKTT